MDIADAEYTPLNITIHQYTSAPCVMLTINTSRSFKQRLSWFVPLVFLFFASHITNAGAFRDIVQLPSNASYDRAKSSVLVSYVIFAPSSHSSYWDTHKRGTKSSTFQQCLSNVDLFLARGIVEDKNNDFVFNLVGETEPTRFLSFAARTYSNVHIATTANTIVDRIAHSRTLRQYIDSKDYFLFLNCGSRGPYYPHKWKYIRPTIMSYLFYQVPTLPSFVPNLSWLETFLSKLDKNTRAVGSTISCEISPHIQFDAIATDIDAARIILRLWGNEKENEIKVIKPEIEFSREVLRNGYNIASMDSRLGNPDYRVPGICNIEDNDLRANSVLADPYACLRPDDPGCNGIEPCEVVFLRYSGQIESSNSISNSTIELVKKRDRETNNRHYPSLCRDAVVPYSPYHDLPNIAQGIFEVGNNDKIFRTLVTAGKKNDDVVIIIRSHEMYALKLCSMIRFFQSLNLPYRLRVIIAPTHAGTYEKLVKVVKRYRKNTSLQVDILEVPEIFYQNHSTFLPSICTAEWKASMLKNNYDEKQVGRFCGIDSPTHYLIVDVIIYMLKNQCTSCSQVIVTNADNAYSPLFFDYITTNHSIVDVAMTNMITKGKRLDVRADVGKIDLGSYAVSLDFLRKTGVTFLNSLPARAAPQHYHDADGHYIRKLREKGARMIKSEGYLFFHN